MFAIGVPVRMSQEFKVRVFAAAKSYIVGNKSIDYTLKRYREHWNFEVAEDDPEYAIVGLCALIRSSAARTISYLMAIQDKPDLPNVFACTAAIFRLSNSFRAAILCVRQGMHIETVTLSRLILEQIAWVAAIYPLKNDHYEYTELAPQSCIKALKHLIPEAGKVYGELSETSHLQFEATLSYIKVQGDDLAVHVHDLARCFEDAILLLHLIDWLEVVGEHVYFEQIESPRSIVVSADGTKRLKPDRQSLAVINEAKTFESSIKAGCPSC